jgi:hypothetical protein
MAPVAGWSSILHRWPTWAAIALAVPISLDLSGGTDLAPAVAASALIYLGAATVRKRSAVWAVFPAAVLVIFAAEAGGVDPTWALIGVSVPLVSYGLWSGTRRANPGLPYQVIAMAVFGATAAVALGAGDDVGALLVAAGLVGHAAWDVYHHRADKVVTRSYAELCFVLDACLAVVVVAVTF